MKDKAFKRIVAGLEDAIAFVRGNTTKGRVAVSPACPHERALKAIRAKTKRSQAGAKRGRKPN